MPRPLTTLQTGEVDLAAAATTLSVHYQTVYRWVRSGALPARVEKGTYRIATRDLDELVRSGGHALRAKRVRRTPAALDHARRQVTEALIAGDEPAVRAIVRRIADATSLTSSLDGVVAPALAEIGRRWRDGTLTVWAEHRAAAIVGRLLGDLARTGPGRPRGTAVVSTVAGDHHALPAEMAVAALRENHWRVHHLGADVPTAEIVDFTRTHPCDLAVITVTFDVDDQAAELRRRLEPIVPHVLVGGSGRTLAELLQLARAASTARRAAGVPA